MLTTITLVNFVPNLRITMKHGYAQKDECTSFQHWCNSDFKIHILVLNSQYRTILTFLTEKGKWQIHKHFLWSNSPF